MPRSTQRSRSAGLSGATVTTLRLLMLGWLAACGGSARLSVAEGTGPNPMLPDPRTSLIPTVAMVTAKGWAAGQTPVARAGMEVNAFASDLNHPRWLYVLPNGDVLVAETNGPRKESKGIRAWIQKRLTKRAGGAVVSPERIVLLRDRNGDGIAEQRSVFLSKLTSPFGMALVGDDLYVANTDALLRFRYRAGDTSITAAGSLVASLPGGPINHHWTKSLLASPDGRFLYVGVGSNSNAGEAGLEAEAGRAAIWQVEVATGAARVFASGLRNPVGMAWEPTTKRLWTAVNERDELGSDLVPDYLTSVNDGGFYGFPFSYFGDHVDTRVTPQNPALVKRALVPDYALGPHTASLGLAWYADLSAPPLGADAITQGMFVGQHGSWNRKPRSGYKVIFVPFTNGRPSAMPQDVLTGFVNADGVAYGRPVGVVVDATGALLVADDVGNTIWRVRKEVRAR